MSNTVILQECKGMTVQNFYDKAFNYKLCISAKGREKNSIY